MTARILRYAPILLLLGCSTGIEPRLDSETRLRALEDVDVELVSERTQYTRGESVKLVLHNRSNQRLGYNLCTSSLEHRTGSGWERSEFLRVCTTALYTLEPGARAAHEEVVSNWPTGEHRLVTTLYVLESDERGEVFSNVFRVTD